MRKLISDFIYYLKSCHICHGMGSRETEKGPDKCPACNGRGVL